MRVDSPFVLAAAGTIALHLVLVVAADAVVVINPYRPAPPAPRVELVDVEVPPVIKEPPPPVVKPVLPPVVDEAPKPRPRAVRKQVAPPPVAEPPPQAPPEVDSGGDRVVSMPDIAPGATGTVPVRPGKRNTRHVGRGGAGGGTGSGVGTGPGEAPPPPVSVATIKTRALPRGDYSYFKDYPVEARQLGIEGAIRVKLIVDATGKVTSAVLLNKLGHGLDKLALDRARQIQFDPAKDTDDKPVTSVVIWTFHMTLPK